MLFGAVLGIIVGILIMIFRLEIALVILPSLIGVAVVRSAALCIMASLRYRELRVSSWWLPLIAGAGSIDCGDFDFFESQQHRIAAHFGLLVFIVLFFPVFGSVNTVP